MSDTFGDLFVKLFKNPFSCSKEPPPLWIRFWISYFNIGLFKTVYHRHTDSIFILVNISWSHSSFAIKDFCEDFYFYKVISTSYYKLLDLFLFF